MANPCGHRAAGSILSIDADERAHPTGRGLTLRLSGLTLQQGHMGSSLLLRANLSPRLRLAQALALALVSL